MVLKEWPEDYSNLVLIEYMFETWEDENVELLEEYARNYGTAAGVPKLIMGGQVFAGREGVKNGNSAITSEGVECTLKQETKPFENIDLNALPGEPLKLWARGRFLQRTGNGQIPSSVLKYLLFSQDLNVSLKELETNHGINVEEVTPTPAPIAYDEVHFKKAYRIGGSWLIQFNETVFSGGSSPTSSESGKTNTVEIPLIGQINVQTTPLIVTTILIGLADGFNPCAFFVLTFLLTALIMARSRKKILIVGGIFIFFSALIYFVSMLALYGVFSFVVSRGFLNPLVALAGLVAIVAGAINIKDHFFFKKGISLTLPTKTAQQLPKKVNKIMGAETLPALVVGTAFFAVTVNLYEMICTVGFPWVYNTILKQNALSISSAVFYLLVYNVFYVVPLAIIVLLFAFTLGGEKFTKEKVKSVKLVSGFMILFMGGGLLYSLEDPSVIENPVVLFSLIVLAVIVSGVVLLVEKQLKKSGKTGGKPK
jgi:hypothetical protein